MIRNEGFAFKKQVEAPVTKSVPISITKKKRKMKNKIVMSSAFPVTFELKSTLLVNGLNSKNKSGFSYIRVPNISLSKKCYRYFKNQLPSAPGMIVIIGEDKNCITHILEYIDSKVDLRADFDTKKKNYNRFDWLLNCMIEKKLKNIKIIRCRKSTVD